MKRVPRDNFFARFVDNQGFLFEFLLVHGGIGEIKYGLRSVKVSSFGEDFFPILFTNLLGEIFPLSLDLVCLHLLNSVVYNSTFYFLFLSIIGFVLILLLRPESTSLFFYLYFIEICQ
jgi:hypothetical protein